MSDERFFSQVKSSLQGYSPEVPEAVYQGMRKKLWWSNFTKLSATRFNMWYLLLLIGAGSFASARYYMHSCEASKSSEFVAPAQPLMVQEANYQVGNASSQDVNTSCTAIPSATASCCSGSKSCSGSAKSAAGAQGSVASMNQSSHGTLPLSETNSTSPSIVAPEHSATAVTADANSNSQPSTEVAAPVAGTKKHDGKRPMHLRTFRDKSTQQ